MMRIKIGCLSLVIALLTATAAAAGDSVPLRSYTRFHLDSGTADGLWAEIGAMYQEDDENRVETDVTTVVARLAYGGEYAEAGLLIPYHDISIDPAGFRSSDEDGIGDVQLYGKVIPIRTELIDLGAGLDMSFPSGDDDDGLGAGETSFIPFLTGAVHLGTVDVRGHFGYRFYTDKDMWESFHYGFGLYAPVTDRVALRTEFNAVVQKAPGADPDPWTFEPGVDIYLPAGEDMSVIIRPTGQVAMNDDAPDWGVGGSVVLSWSPL